MSTSRDASEQIGITNMAHEGFQEYLRIRGLQNMCPFLAEYVNPDSDILDVGCGPGSISVDIAAVSSSARVVGLDANEEAIAEAKELARTRGVQNIRFQTGDVYALPFDDHSFDLTYSHALLEWTRDATAVLREKQRVTRKGGWVIAMVASLVDLILYPECPTIQAYIAFQRQAKQSIEGYRYFNATTSHEIVSFFVDAGFRDYRIQVYVPPAEIAYQGSSYFEYRCRAARTFATPQDTDSILTQRGILQPDFRQRMAEEVDAWCNHPHAFTYHPRVAAIARVE